MGGICSKKAGVYPSAVPSPSVASTHNTEPIPVIGVTMRFLLQFADKYLRELSTQVVLCPFGHRLLTSEREFNCNGCGKTDYIGPHFFCQQCDYDLCRDCSPWKCPQGHGLGMSPNDQGFKNNKCHGCPAPKKWKESHLICASCDYELCHDCEHRTTTCVCDTVVKPLTTATANSFAEYYNRISIDKATETVEIEGVQYDSALFGKATVFVSHAWKCNFLELVETLREWWEANGKNPHECFYNYQAVVQFNRPPELKSSCPSAIYAQVGQTVIVQGVGFVDGSSLVCILDGNFSYPAVLTNPTTVTCDLNWPDATFGVTVFLNIANDGSLETSSLQVPLPITILGACDAKKANSVPSGSECICPAGRYDNNGASCDLCPNGSYQPFANNKTSCVSCGSNEDTNGALGSRSPSACVCAPANFRDPRSKKCIPCVSGMYCPGNDVIDILPGYWRASPNTPKVVGCPGGTAACIGNTGNNTAATASYGNELCALGYSGPLCSVCSQGFAKLGDGCIRCPHAGLNDLFVLILVALALSLAYMLVKSATSTALMLGSVSGAEKHNRGALGVMFKVMLNFLQVLFYIGRLSSNWSDLAHRFFEAIGVVGSLSPNNYTIKCATNWRFYDTLILVYLSPAIVVVIISAVYAFRHIYWRMDLRDSITDFQLAVMLLLYQIHPTIMLEVITSFPCVKVPGTHTSYLRADFSVDCKSQVYKTYSSISALFLVVYILGMMVLVVWRLFVNHKLGRLALPSYSAFHKFAFFFAGYRDKFYFWESVILLRKMGIVGFSVMQSPMLQLVFANVIISMAYALNAQFLPFSSHLINRIESLTLIALFVNLIYGFLFVNESSNGNNTTWISVLVIVTNTGVIAFLLAACGSRLREYLVGLDAWLESVMSKISKDSNYEGGDDSGSSRKNTSVAMTDRKSARMSMQKIDLTPAPLALPPGTHMNLEDW